MDGRMGFPWDAQQYVIGIALDMEKGKEYVCIGEMPGVMAQIDCLQDTPVSAWVKRPLGTFLFDCFEHVPQAKAFVDALVNTDSLDHELAREQAEHLFESRNLGHRFIAVRLWQQIAAWTEEPEPKRKWFAPKQTQPEEVIDHWGWIEKLILPFHYPLLDMVLDWQKEYPQEPLEAIREFEDEIIRYEFTASPLTLRYTRDKRLLEFAIVDESILSLMLYYLKRLYEHKKYVRKCPVCDKLFLADTAKMVTLCSDECRRERRRENKQRYDKSKRNVKYEKQYKSAYAYWYKRVRAAQARTDILGEQLKAIQDAFTIFKEESKQKKKQVKGSKLLEEEYCKWLKTQRYVISNIVDTQ